MSALVKLADFMSNISVLATIGSFFWLLFCLIRRRDKNNAVKVLKYSFIVTIISVMIVISEFEVIVFVALIYGGYRLTKYYKIKKIEREKARILEYERRDRIIEKTLDTIFNDNEMKDKLDEFIIQHTKRHDFGEINHDEYNSTLDLLIKYLKSKVNTEFNIPIDDEHNSTFKLLIKNFKRKINTGFMASKSAMESHDYGSPDATITLNKEMLSDYIKRKKIKVYADDLKKIVNVQEYGSVEALVRGYLSIYGEKGLEPLNLQILSEVAEEDYDEISDIALKEYAKMREEYEMLKIETRLFNSGSKSKDINYVDSLSGFEFEDFLKNLFIGFGYTSEDLSYSNDYGADLIISKGLKKIVIQAKNYQGSVGNKAVQEVVSAKVYYKCDIAMVITNSHYTHNAIKTARASGVILIDRDKLIRILNEGVVYFNSLVF